jgi:hypothetical protein
MSLEQNRKELAELLYKLKEKFVINTWLRNLNKNRQNLYFKIGGKKPQVKK